MDRVSERDMERVMGRGTENTGVQAGQRVPARSGAGRGIRAREWLRARLVVLRRRSDAGMSTSEYAMGTIAACAFAAVLYKVVTSEAVSSALQATIGRALDAPF